MVKSSSRSDGMSRANRKFEKKLHFFELVRDTMAKKAIAKENRQRRQGRRQKKLKTFDLSSLAESLPDFDSHPKPELDEFKLNNKTRNDLVVKESNQLKSVTSHPIFWSDPFEAIYQHLKGTQPAIDFKPKVKTRWVVRARQKMKGKNSIAMKSMEIQ